MIMILLDGRPFLMPPFQYRKISVKRVRFQEDLSSKRVARDSTHDWIYLLFLKSNPKPLKNGSESEDMGSHTIQTICFLGLNFIRYYWLEQDLTEEKKQTFQNGPKLR